MAANCQSNKIHAPYNFVPLSSWVYQPDWHNEVTQDIPFEDGVCGTLDITVTAYTSLLLGEKDKQGKVKPYQLPNNEYAIPGSSLKGMIRNVLEIASFGKMRIVDDKRYGIRDLKAPFYQKSLTKQTEGAYETNAQTGFLNFSSDNGWQITPCECARVESDDLGNYSKGNVRLKFSKVKQKYNNWLKQNKSLSINFEDGGKQVHSHNKRKIRLKYRKATKLGKGNEGHLVFTGQVPKKHMEFIFFNKQPHRLTVEDSVMQGFKHIYKDSDHWEHLQHLNKSGKFPHGIPVFYLADGNIVKSLGISQMYKLAYRNSIGDMIDHTSENHRANNQPDLAELMFGMLDDDDGKQSLKGRISFSAAQCTESKDIIQKRLDSYQTILGSPQPTYFPSYIKQEKRQGKVIGSYQTYMDDSAEIRGWKRYPVRAEPLESNNNLGDNTDVQVNLKPIRANKSDTVSFTGKVRFHNLKPAELGALVWAITWGNNTSLRHAIGMGKALGFGQIGIQINQSDLIPNNLSDITNLDDYLQRFKATMEQAHPSGWQLSEAMLNLQAMADPQKAKGKTLEHMEIGCFAGAKDKKNQWVLDDYIDYESEKKRIAKLQEEQARQEKIARRKAKEAEIAAQRQQAEEANKEQYLSQFEDVEKAEKLYSIKTKLEQYTKASGVAKTQLKEQITRALKDKREEAKDWTQSEMTELIDLLEEALNTAGLYKKNQRTRVKKFIKQHKH